MALTRCNKCGALYPTVSFTCTQCGYRDANKLGQAEAEQRRFLALRQQAEARRNELATQKLKALGLVKEGGDASIEKLRDKVLSLFGPWLEPSEKLVRELAKAASVSARCGSRLRGRLSEAGLLTKRPSKQNDAALRRAAELMVKELDRMYDDRQAFADAMLSPTSELDDELVSRIIPTLKQELSARWRNASWPVRLLRSVVGRRCPY